jgi:serine/threonine-protein kinase RsbW
VSNENVRLAVPALPEYIRLARLTAAGLASRLGFSYDEVEDLRVAVDELCYLLVGPDGRPGQISLTFAMDNGSLVISGQGAAGPRPVELAELSEQILAALVDSYEVKTEDGSVAFQMIRHRAAG